MLGFESTAIRNYRTKKERRKWQPVPGLDDELAQYGAIALAFGVAAVVVVVATRGRLGYRAERMPLEPSVRS